MIMQAHGSLTMHHETSHSCIAADALVIQRFDMSPCARVIITHGKSKSLVENIDSEEYCMGRLVLGTSTRGTNNSPNTEANTDNG